MDLTTIAGFAAGPFLMVILGWFFTLMGRVVYGQWDQAIVPNGAKIVIAPVVGVGLGILGMFADTIIGEPPITVNVVSWVKYCFAGFLLGATAIGLNQMYKGGK